MPARNLVLGLPIAFLKSSSTVDTGAPASNANDGDDITPWGEGLGDPAIGVAEAYWAADVLSSEAASEYRILQMGGNAPSIQNVATEVRIYGSNDAGAWSWLPTGKLVADPAANGWTLVATRTNSLAYNDSGRRHLAAPGTYRYWLFRAVAGGTADWDVEEFEVWQDPHKGTSGHAARCDHGHDADAIHYDPSASELDALNVQDAIDEIAARAWKQPVRAATTANGVLATAFENGDTVDGVVLATGDRILLKSQTAGAENGIYTVNASGSPTRTADFDTGAEALGAVVLVLEGTANADKAFACTTNGPITLGTTALVFGALGGGAGDMLKSVYDTDDDGIVDEAAALVTAGAVISDIAAGGDSINLRSPVTNQGVYLLIQPNGTPSSGDTSWHTYYGRTSEGAAREDFGGFGAWHGQNAYLFVSATGDAGDDPFPIYVIMERNGVHANVMKWDDDSTVLFYEHLRLSEIAAPATPAAGEAALYVKSDGHIYLKNDAGTEFDLTAAAGSILATIFDAKGDLIAATAADTAARVPVGTNGQVLTADSTASAGVAWADPTGESNKFVVDAGSPSYAGTPLTITVTSKFGIDGSGNPYYNAAGVTSGEEAALLRDPDTGQYLLRSYSF